MDNQGTDNTLADLTAEIVSAFVSHNSVQTTALPDLISAVHAALSGLNAPPEPVADKPTPAVSIRKSITPDHLISLEDGKSYKSLKRHLSGRGLTPADYRQKWGLPSDYPMVAPNYAKQRSELAKSLGLGRKPAAAAVAAPEPAASVEAPEASAAPAKRGRPKKSADAKDVSAPKKRGRPTTNATAPDEAGDAS